MFKRRRFPVEIILVCVRWYCKYGISYRDLAEMMQERGVEVEPSTIMRWVHRYAPELEKRVRPYQGYGSRSWRVDETYVKVGGKWKYLFRAVDKHGALIDFMLSDRRNTRAAHRFLAKALTIMRNWPPTSITTDKLRSYPEAIERLKRDGLLPEDTLHRTSKYLNNTIEADHGRNRSFDSKAGAAEGGMPIKRENKSRYPSDWIAISNRIRFERAGGRCESPGCAAVHGQPHPLTGATVVLTVAHLDHTPENCADDTLLAGCQRCHNRYDRAHRLTTRNADKRSLMLLLPFGEPEA